MPIELVYGADQLLSAQAAALGSGAAAAEEQRWREAQIGEQQRQFDLDYDMRLQLAALQNQEQRSARGQQFALGAANLQSQNYNNQLDYDLGSQQLAQRDEQFGVEAALQAQQQQQLTNRTQLSQLGQIARQQQQQKFELAMAERKSGEEWMRTATPRQQQQFRQRWEQTHGMPWTAPEEALAAQEDEQQQARIMGIRKAFANPFDPEQSLLPEGAEEWALQLTPKELMDSAMKAQGEERQRRALMQKEKQEEIKYREAAANMERDDVRADQQLQHTQTAHEQTMAFAAEQAKQRLMMNAVNSYQAAKLKWAAEKNKAFDAEGKASLGPEPKLEDFMLPEMREQQSGGPPKSITTQAEYDALGPGEEYIDATTGARARK